MDRGNDSGVPINIPDLDDAGTSSICGFFTLPELPDAAGETISNTPIQSGRILISPP